MLSEPSLALLRAAGPVLPFSPAGPAAMQVRALAHPADSGRNRDLRCPVRERLADLLRRNHPRSLPKIPAAPTQDVPGPPKEYPHEQTDA